MPYKRRYFKKKRFVRRRFRKRSRMSKRIRFIARNMDMEKKYVVSTGTQSFFFYDGTDGGVGGMLPIFLNGPAQGDNPTARNGNSIRSYSIDLEYFIQRGTNYNAPVRVCVVMDKQPDNAQVSVANILDDITAGDSIVAGLNPANQRRFWMLYTKVHIIDTYHITVKGKYYKRLHFRVRYSGNAAGYNNCVNGGLWLFALSTTKDTTTTANNPAITYRAKYKFIDN